MYNQTTKLSPTITAFFFSGSRPLMWTKTCVQSSSALPAALLYVTLPLTAALPLLPSNHMVIAKMSIYKRMRRACCFDCGRSERDCSCMSGRVRGNVDTLERTFPLSSVSVNDCSTSFRACKFNLNTHSSMSVLVCGNRPCVLCCCALWSCDPLSSCCHPNVVLCVMTCFLCSCVYDEKALPLALFCASCVSEQDWHVTACWWPSSLLA